MVDTFTPRTQNPKTVEILNFAIGEKAMRVPTALLLLVCSLSAKADGVIEINQLCVASGCFDGDSGGFPVQIASAGSYRLTSNLDVPQGTSAIIVFAPSATLDLNGHTIAGPNQCSRDGCNYSDNFDGIREGVGGNEEGLTIRNGTIRGMGGYGIQCFRGPCFVDGIRIVENGFGGVRLASGDHSEYIRESTVLRNGGNGITIFNGVVERTTSSFNQDIGVSAIDSSVIDSVFNQNGTRGISISSGRATGNIVDGNLDLGVNCSSCQLENNTIINNGSNGVFVFGDTISAANRLAGNGASDFSSAPTLETAPSLCGSSVCFPP